MQNQNHFSRQYSCGQGSDTVKNSTNHHRLLWNLYSKIQVLHIRVFHCNVGVHQDFKFILLNEAHLEVSEYPEYFFPGKERFFIPF